MIKKNLIDTKQPILLIGASTGGPNAIEIILRELTKDLNLIVLIVQHMPKGFTKTFAERLNKICDLNVMEATDGIKILKNNVYIAPGGYHMILNENGVINLNTDALVWGVRPAVDKLFISASSIYKENVISVVLTGMGKDGAKGSVKVKENNGITIAQDQKTSVIYGMPRVAFETGCIDYVLPLNDIVKKIKSLIKN